MYKSTYLPSLICAKYFDLSSCKIDSESQSVQSNYCKSEHFNCTLVVDIFLESILSQLIKFEIFFHGF